MTITTLIKQGESETLEFKQSFEKEAIESLCAMANKNGGTVLIGVTDKGEIKGVTLGKETLPHWLNNLSNATEPRLIPSISVHKINDKTVVAIEISSYPIKPVFNNGRAFFRVVSSNKQLNAKEISELHMQTTHNSWDALFSARTMGDININYVKSFLSKIRNTNRRNLKGITNWKQALEKFELIVDNKPTWACFMLFKKNPSAIPHSIIRVARIKGTSKIIDDNFIEGALMTLVDPAMNAIRKNLRVEYVIKGKPERDEVWEYPTEAIREALLNAICHRDYTDTSDILIKIFDDHLSIWNPGLLPHNLSIAQLMRNEHSSKPRNKLITQAFYDMGDIERLGSGIKRIMDSCKEAGLPLPEIKEDEGGFHIIFKRPANNIYADKSVEPKIELGVELIDRQKKAIKHVQKKGKITNSEYQKLFKVSHRTASNDLSELVSYGIFKREGKTGKGTFYILATRT